MSEQRERIAELYYVSGSVQFGEFELSAHKDNPDLPLSPWYLHYPKQNEPGTEYLPELFELVGAEFYEMSQALHKTALPKRVAGLPKGALGLGNALAKHYPTYPKNLLVFDKTQHRDGRTEFTDPEGEYETGDSLQPCEDHVSGARNNLLFLANARKLGLEVTSLLVVVDRQQGGVENLAKQGVTMRAVFTADELLEYGIAGGHITPATFEEVQTYRAENQFGLVGLRNS